MQKIIQKWKSLSPVAKTSLALVIAKFFQKGLAFITSPIFTRIMPSSEYGIISTFTSWQSVLYIIATLNMSSGVFNNGMVDYKDDRESFISSILGLANLCTLFFMIVYLVFQKRLNALLELPQILIWIMIAYFFVTPAYNYWMGKQRFEYKYKAVLFLSIASSLIPSVLAVVFVLIAPDSYKAIAKVSATEVSAILIGLVFYFYTISKAKISTTYWKYALEINLPLIPHYLSMYVLSSSDRIMITKLVNTSATAIYSVAYTTASVVLVFWNSVDSAYAPWIYQRMSEKKYAAIQKRGEEVILLFALCAILITLFAPELIMVLGPSEYYSGMYAIPPVVAGVFFTAVFTLYMRIELYLKRSKTIMVATVLAAAVNILLNAVCIPTFGYVGAAYTTLICYVLLAVFHAINLNRLGYGHVYNNKHIFGISAIVCIFIVSLSLTYSHTVLRYMLIAVMAVVLFINRDKFVSLVKKETK